MKEFLISIWTFPNDFIGWIVYFFIVKVWYGLIQGFKMKREKKSFRVNILNLKWHGRELKYYLMTPANQKSKDRWRFFRSTAIGQNVFMFAEKSIKKNANGEHFYYFPQIFLIHEYGHVAQCRQWGILFLFMAICTIPIYFLDWRRQVKIFKKKDKELELEYIRKYFTNIFIERDANLRAGITWQDMVNVRSKIIIDGV